MSDLANSFHKAAAVDWEIMREHATQERDRMGHEADSFADGAKEMHARLAPLLELAAKAIEALESIAGLECLPVKYEGYFRGLDKDVLIECIVEDTGLARETLAEIRSGLEGEK